MKDKFIRVVSPIAVAIMLVLDAAVIYFSYFSVFKIIDHRDFYSITFGVLILFALIVAIFVNKEILTQGIKFDSKQVEFTAIDENNIFSYKDIEKVTTEKDDKASLIKNFVDRQSKIIIELKEDKIVTIDIGLTTKRALQKIEDEFEARLN